LQIAAPAGSFTAMLKRLAAAALGSTLALLFAAALAAQQPAPSTATVIRAGRLLDPDGGRILANRIILVLGNRIRDVGPNVAIPAGAEVIDLSRMTVMSGLVDAHNHLALTYKPEPENNVYYYSYVPPTRFAFSFARPPRSA
jgi:hypothetical protein